MKRAKKKKRIPSVRPRGRPRKREPSKAVAFRLPGDVIAMATAAAVDQHVSRNKLVELVLRTALEPGFARKKEVTDDGQIDLFA